MKVFMASLGCAKNLVDAEIALGGILGDGFELAVDPGIADVILINTCGFIQSARDEACEVIAEYLTLKRRRNGRVVVLAMGCLAQRSPGELLERFPGLDAVWGLGILENAGMALRELVEGRAEDKKAGFDLAGHVCAGPRLVSTPPSFSYLKIADGCDNRCRYCAIPDIRGPMRSRPLGGLIDEARLLEDRGSLELVLVAQDTTMYGGETAGRTPGLAPLLENLLRATAFPRIRVLYAHPAHIGEDVVGLLLAEPRLCGYLDLPFQHVSDRILDAMGRGYGKERVLELCGRFSGNGFALRSTFLTGFPGEDEADFLEVLDLVRSGAFRHLGAFAFSPEEGTPAVFLQDRVPREEAERRRDELLLSQRKVAFEWLDSRLGGSVEVLVDRNAGAGVSEGRTPHEAPDVDGVVLVRGKVRPGTIVTACVAERDGYDLIADPERVPGKKSGRAGGRRRGRR